MATATITWKKTGDVYEESTGRYRIVRDAVLRHR